MTTEDKLLKLKKLADAMYYAAQYLTTDASRLHKAMDEYHQFIIYEYYKKEPVSEDLGKVGSLKSLEYYPEKKTTNKTSKGVFDANMPRRKAYLRGFKDGAHAHKVLIANKPVSEDLPHIRHRDTLDEFAYQCAYDLSNDWAKETPEWRDVKTACKLGAQWQKQKDSIVSEELEEASKEWLKPQLDKSYADYGEVKMMELTHFDGYAMLDAIEFGAKWQKEHLWKPADGDDLPEYEREVVVFTQNFPDDAGLMRVAIGHRPNPDGWDGKSIATGKVEHYTPQTYDKGGWNIPDVIYWLDVELPKEIEL